eukprot:364190-Chlamydomonas_euryale.AAC.3
MDQRVSGNTFVCVLLLCKLSWASENPLGRGRPASLRNCAPTTVSCVKVPALPCTHNGELPSAPQRDVTHHSEPEGV